MKVLNLYAGIGGNRKLWQDVEVTAVELNPQIAEIYQDFFPNDKVIVGDAHEYLLAHYKEFDFIWTSPVCVTHSRLRLSQPNLVVYPDMALYQEIILLREWFKGNWVVENVQPYYDSLIPPTTEIDRHYFWANFFIPPFGTKTDWRTATVKGERELLTQRFGINLDSYSGIDKRKALRNCVVPELGLHIFNCAKSQSRQLFEMAETKQVSLFEL